MSSIFDERRDIYYLDLTTKSTKDVTKEHKGFLDNHFTPLVFLVFFR